MSFYKNYQKELIDSINLFLNNIITINNIFEKIGRASCRERV